MKEISNNMFKSKKSEKDSPRFEQVKNLFSQLRQYKILRKANVDSSHLLGFGLSAFILLSLLFHVDQVAFALSADTTLANVNQIIYRADSMLNANPALSLLAIEEDEQLKPFLSSIYDIQPEKKAIKEISLASQIITRSPSADFPAHDTGETLRRLAKNSAFKSSSHGFFQNSKTDSAPFQLNMPVKNFIITSRYGWRHGRPHRGIDLSAPIGTTVYSSESGTVVMAEPYYGYGKLVVIDHGNGMRTRYAHLSKMFVSEGSKVFKGQIIGSIGMTGSTTGPHLHFEVVHNNVHRNPEPFLNQ